MRIICKTYADKIFCEGVYPCNAVDSPFVVTFKDKFFTFREWTNGLKRETAIYQECSGLALVDQAIAKIFNRDDKNGN